jgi:hypothetical protein
LQLQWRCEAGFSARGCQHFADRPSDAAALVAGTDDGVFTRAESGWQLIGLSAAAVNDIVWKAQDHLLASVEFGVDQTPDHRLVETRDGGVSWHAVEDDFGGGGGNLEADGGLDSYPGLLPGPSVSKGIRHVMGQPQRLLVSGEAGIVQTLDDGISWQTLLADDAHRFHFDVLHDVQPGDSSPRPGRRTRRLHRTRRAAARPIATRDAAAATFVPSVRSRSSMREVRPVRSGKSRPPVILYSQIFI